MTITLFLVILIVLVLVHELGHFIAAKLASVPVLEFGIGYPPRVLAVGYKGTTYSLNLLPLGGFVRLLGEEDPSDPRSFGRKPAPTRLAVMAAGPAMNILLPLLLFSWVAITPSVAQVHDVVVTSVMPASPAATADVRPGDIIRQVDGRAILNSADLRLAIQLRLSADTNWLVERSGTQTPLRLTEARVAPPPGEGPTGVRIADARISVIQVQNDSTAQQVGLLPGDLLISVNGIIARDEEQVTGAIYDNLSADTNIEIKVLRDGILRDLLYRPDLGPLTGLVFRSNPDLKQSISPGQSLLKGASRIWEVLVLSRNEVSRWIAGSSSIEVVGPIGIAQATGQVATGGLNPILVWTALLSVNLALINLLPIPALDGGRIALVLLELIRGGRRLSANRERQLHLLGFGLLMVLVIFVSVSDLRRLVTSATMFGS